MASISTLPVLNKVAEIHDPEAQKKLIWDIVNQDKLLSKIELFGSRVLVAIYARPNKTAGGIYLANSETVEDKYQGKVGLLLKSGPDAFKYNGSYAFIAQEEGEEYEAYKRRVKKVTPKAKDWVFARPADGDFSEITLGGYSCRIFDSSVIVGRVKDPRIIY
jgi:hypothetical protein